jgi:GT2 family glycosyltransferase
MIDLSIIIVNYNALEFLRKCIVSIIENTKGVSCEIIVVDNNSSDRSSEMLRKEYPQVKLIVNKENVGFSKANNQGVKISKESKYVLFLNPDTVIQKQTIREMLNFMNTHKDVGASTCKLVMPNGKMDDATHRGFPTPWNALCHFSGFEKLFPKNKWFTGYSLGWKNFNSTHEIDVLAGAFMLVRRIAGKEAKWWDEDYFFYGEDIDFCYILKQKGWKIYYVPSVSITHYKGVSGGIKVVSKNITTASEETKRRATKWRFEAMRIFYKKHYQQKYPWLINALVNIGISFRENI